MPASRRGRLPKGKRMPTPLDLLTPKASLALIAIALVAGYGFGRHVAQGEAASQQVNGLIQARQQDKTQDQDNSRRQASANTLAATARAGQIAQAQRDRAITKEVIRYVQVTPPADRCLLPGPWRLRHDAAATGNPLEDPDTGPLGAGAGAPVEDAAALETVAENYQSARECFAKLDYWQQRYLTIEKPAEDVREGLAQGAADK